MFESIRNILIEQQSPTEVIIFILFSIMVCMAVAIVTYIAIMLVIWAVHLRNKIRLARVFLPTGEQFREYCGEYFLAIATSLLLALTMGTKHDLVQMILETDLNEVVQIGDDSPFADELDETGSLMLSDFIVQPIANGASDDVTLFIEEVVLPALEREGLAYWINERNLLLACVVLSVLYILWLAWHRLREPGDTPEYGRTVKGVFVMAICVTLLLLSPTLLADEQLADSAVAVVREREMDLLEEQESDRQRQLTDMIQDDPVGSISTNLTSLETDLTELAEALDDLSSQHRGDISDVTSMLDQIHAAGDRVEDLQGAISTLARQVTSHDNVLEDHDTRIDDLLSRLQDDAESLANLLNQIREMQILHQRDIDSLRNRSEAASADTATLIVHAAQSIAYRLGDEQLTGSRCLELEPGAYPINAGRAAIVFGPNGNPIRVIRLEAGDVTAVWIAPNARVRPPQDTNDGGETTDTRQACADLVVDSISPRWDGDAEASIIEVVIRNAGNADAPFTESRLVDPSTRQDSGELFSDSTRVPRLAPGRSATVRFRLPYWVYNPDALLVVTADSNDDVNECDEENNEMRFEAIG